MDGSQPLEQWFARQGWEPFAFQREVWSAFAAGESGLIHSATGTGKTLAAAGGPLSSSLEDPGGSLRLLWLTPLRALAGDTAQAIQAAAHGIGSPWTVAIRTGDTSSAERSRQKKHRPEILVTTPESLSLMLSQPDAPDRFASLQAIVADEWHELMASKRGVMAELCFERLEAFRPGLSRWGVSATLGNLEEALSRLVGVGRTGRLVRGELAKEVVVDALLPSRIERFPWAGHMGLRMLDRVIGEIETCRSCLLFTNTRAMSEIWYREIVAKRPDWADVMALHHGSMSREEREKVEDGLRAGTLRAVVCTSSLDLGVDFSPVERVLQIGSPKGVARLLQRAGRSGHRPGAVSRVTCVPTHAAELVDVAAAREAAARGQIEARPGVARPLDLLAQHLCTVGAGTGFEPEAMKAEVRRTVAFANLSDAEWDLVIDFLVRGGESLRAYPQYHRIVIGVDGLARVENRDIAMRHRMSIGTITSDPSVNVVREKGGYVGTVEESFAAKLKRGDRFAFAGKVWEYVRTKDMSVQVRPASGNVGLVPRWGGGRMPLSSELAAAVRRKFEEAKYGELVGPEMEALAPLFRLQADASAIPAADELLIERVQTREGHHLFVFPFEGRLVHEGLAALFATRLARREPTTFTLACNDSGFELLSAEPVDLRGALEEGLLSSENLWQDIRESVNSVEMARRQFREIARIAGLVWQGFPGRDKSAKQVQASSGLIFDVFRNYDPDNVFLRQADREVLERQFEESRLSRALQRMALAKLLIAELDRPSPFAFPVFVDRLRETVSTETLESQIERMVLELDEAARRLVD